MTVYIGSSRIIPAISIALLDMRGENEALELRAVKLTGD